MKSNYDVYMCRAQDCSEDEKSFKLRSFEYILNNLEKDTNIGDIAAMVDAAWSKHSKLMKFANNKGA